MNHPVLTTCAIPRASFRSVFTGNRGFAFRVRPTDDFGGLVVPRLRSFLNPQLVEAFQSRGVLFDLPTGGEAEQEIHDFGLSWTSQAKNKSGGYDNADGDHDGIILKDLSKQG
ncbi:hypothetical protein ACNJX9_33975 [Bradyrhizobium sp. DASA03076]|uniref:hypothetical protein n=1 Tax=Bradyrhizobium sp. BLXBL-03 TaxID=3395916 RepID=UPI003F71464F